MSSKLAAAGALFAALGAVALPSAVKPLSVAAGQPCSTDIECITNYCYQTDKQIASGAALGTCKAQVADGGSCYKDAGCLAGSCNNSICQPQAQTFPGYGITFKKTNSGFIGTISDLAYKQAARPKPAQPYLTFNKHYIVTPDIIVPPQTSGPNSIQRNAEIMTTSGAGHKLAVEAYKVVFPTDSRYASLIYYQLRVPSRSNQCISGTRLDENQDTILYRLAPCQTPVMDFSSTNQVPSWALQLWYPNVNIDTTGSKSLPLMNLGDTASASQGVAYAAPDGTYSTWGSIGARGTATAATLWLGPAYAA